MVKCDSCVAFTEQSRQNTTLAPWLFCWAKDKILIICKGQNIYIYT